ncbi:WD40 repeat domain-containing protein [Vairimorpha necatrix]|uniref:WD40 repeat domain-containing protein n=1 Tax=Vairimorpha necatrix TaxID=6039 RepID=A0AAX4JGB0_9MICR
MNNFSNIEDLFNTIPSTKISIVGIKNQVLNTSALITEPRYDRVINRFIDTKPFKILDAPGMIDDYYLNLLDWSKQDILSIGLSNSVYTFNYSKSEVSEAYTGDDLITSIKSNNNILSVGLNNGRNIFYDIEMNKVVMCRKNHDSRVCAQSWNDNLLCTGDKSGKIIVSDVRTNEYDVLLGHKQEVCGLEWSSDKKYIASGSNDNDIRIWHNNHIYKTLKDHKSAVKALAWCPWKTGILASGGGTKDKCIKMWDIYDGKKIGETQVNSQVCTLNYIHKYKELISSHGYVDNNIILWKASTMKEILSFGKHDNRVLHTALNPDNTILASVGGDENLKFWKISDKTKKLVKRASLGVR